MEYELQQVTELVLYLTAEEARLLHTMVQNPASNEELKEETKLRERLFEATGAIK